MNSNSDAANKAVATFQRGMANVAATQKTSQDALTDIVHSVYSLATGHVPTPAPRGSQASWSNATGHVNDKVK